MLEEVIAEADKHRFSHMHATKLFFEAYQTHKEEFGSFRHEAPADHYVMRMHDRYRFMRDTAINNINNS
ncbi:MAG: hypothetical protein HQ538_06350 [Parcubacteria group bacterium]|nr:hypothetical protein [Parcubacteria group bacterium]